MPRFRRRDVMMLVPLTTPPSPSPLAAVACPTTHAVHITFTFTFARLVGTVDDRVPEVASLVQQSLAFQQQAAVAGIVPWGDARRVGRAASALVVAAPLVTARPHPAGDAQPTQRVRQPRPAPLLPRVRGACLFHGTRATVGTTLWLAVACCRAYCIFMQTLPHRGHVHACASGAGGVMAGRALAACTSRTSCSLVASLTASWSAGRSRPSPSMPRSTARRSAPLSSRLNASVSPARDQVTGMPTPPGTVVGRRSRSTRTAPCAMRRPVSAHLLTDLLGLTARKSDHSAIFRGRGSNALHCVVRSLVSGSLAS